MTVVVLAATDLRDDPGPLSVALPLSATVIGVWSSPSRADALVGSVHVIRLPLSRTAVAGVRARRHRLSRLRALPGYASLDALRAARLRADHLRLSAEYAASTGRPLRAAVLSRWASARGFATRLRGALARRVVRRRDWMGAPASAAPGGSSHVRPFVRDLDDTIGPVLDGLRPDVVIACDLAVLPVAVHAAARARREGRAVRVVYRPRPTAHRGLAWRRIERAYRPRADEVASWPTAVPALPAEQPYKREPRSRPLLGIGPANMAGQAWAWAQAVRRAGVADVEVFAVQRPYLNFPADVRISAAEFARSTRWQQRWAQHVRGSYTHVLMEAGRPVLGTLNGVTFAADVDELRAAGIVVGLVFHGSEIRDPARHAARYPFSPFADPSDALTARLQRQVAELEPLVAGFDGPRFVSTPDLLDDVPGAVWLPVVVDMAVWRSSSPPLQRERPLVVHAPSNRALKGTDLIEPVLADLESRGWIEYRRIENVPPADVPALVTGADIVLDHFGVGNYGVVTCEAMASGRVSISHIAPWVRERVPEPIPTLEATPDTLAAVIEQVLDDRDAARALAASGPSFVARWHDGRASAERLGPFLGVGPQGH